LGFIQVKIEKKKDSFLKLFIGLFKFFGISLKSKNHYYGFGFLNFSVKTQKTGKKQQKNNRKIGKK